MPHEVATHQESRVLPPPRVAGGSGITTQRESSVAGSTSRRRRTRGGNKEPPPFSIHPHPPGTKGPQRGNPRIPLHPIIPVDSSKEPLPDVLGPLAPAATPESWRRGPSGPCNASDTCSRFPPSLPGAAAPALLFVLLLWAFPFLLARVSVEPGLARPFALPQECTQGLGGFPYHNVGGEGAPS